MKMALEVAKSADGDVPVGAVVVKNGEIISKACNKKEKDNDVTSHAEILAIREAEKILQNWRLDDCEMYVTLEPCPMCGWAILQSRIKTLYFGSYDNNYGSFSTSIKLQSLSDSNINIYGGICEKSCDELLNNFFNKIRTEKNNITIENPR